MPLNGTAIGSILDKAICMNPSYDSTSDGAPLLSHLRIGTAGQGSSSLYNTTIYSIKYNGPIGNTKNTTDFHISSNIARIGRILHGDILHISSNTTGTISPRLAVICRKSSSSINISGCEEHCSRLSSRRDDIRRIAAGSHSSLIHITDYASDRIPSGYLTTVLALLYVSLGSITCNTGDTVSRTSDLCSVLTIRQ